VGANKETLEELIKHVKSFSIYYHKVGETRVTYKWQYDDLWMEKTFMHTVDHTWELMRKAEEGPGFLLSYEGKVGTPPNGDFYAIPGDHDAGRLGLLLQLFLIREDKPFFLMETFTISG